MTLMAAMDTKSKTHGGWRPLERVGYSAGCAAGGVALLLLWIFSLTSDALAVSIPARAAKPLR
jgi:hypothetical protein